MSLTLKPCRGAVAYCSKGYLGLITHDAPQRVRYPDGTSALAWCGVRLDAGHHGEPWSSRTPDVRAVVADIDDPRLLALVGEACTRSRKETRGETLSDDRPGGASRG